MAFNDRFKRYKEAIDHFEIVMVVLFQGEENGFIFY